MGPFRRIIILVLDSVGIGEMPDASRFGDQGSDTLGHIAQCCKLDIPNLQRLGLGNIRPLAHIPPAEPALASFGKATLASQGKDTTSGHWEMMGIILARPFPTYPQGFPDTIIHKFEQSIGRNILGNTPASGTTIIEQLGPEHLRTGNPIVYTSADSVFQIATHEDIIPLDQLYELCETARALLRGEHEVGRVIARPFTGSAGQFVRTKGRRDYAILPPGPTVLDQLQESGVKVVAVGKIASIFCHSGIDQELEGEGNSETTFSTIRALRESPEGLIFSNFVDFDTLYGHRNDTDGYARALEKFDRELTQILAHLTDDDLLIITSDHGCDPTTPSIDHSREYALLLAFSRRLQGNYDLATRSSLADVGATVAENFGTIAPAGTSFLGKVSKKLPIATF